MPTLSLLRGIARRQRDTLRLKRSRVLARILRPIIGDRAPIRGTWPSTADFCRGGKRPFTLLSDAGEIVYRLLPAHDLGSPCDVQAAEHMITPATFVATIRGGRTVYDHGVVVAPDNCLLGDLSPDLGGGYNRRALMAVHLPPVLRIKGSAALLSSHAHQRYFHWMFDVLPRLELIEAAGLSPDRYIVNHALPFQTETLRTLGILDRAVEPAFMSQILPESLIAPSLPGHISYMTPRSCAFLREAFLPKGKPSIHRRAIFISRRDALTRRIENEDDVRELLEARGFEILCLDGETVARQAEAFSEADIVIAPHGAGLTNLVFCNAGTTAIEFMPRSYRNFCFRRLCALQGLRYGCVDADGTGNGHDMTINLNTLQHMLRRL